MTSLLNKPLLGLSFVFVIIFLNSQLFFFNVHNPMSIRGFQELFNGLLGLSVVWMLYISQYSNKTIDNEITLLVFLVILAFISDALFAYISYGQPFILGLIESRRIFSSLIVIPVYLILRDSSYSTSDILNLIYISGVIAAIFAFLVNSGLIPEIHVLERREGAFREDRMSIATYYLVFTLILANYYIFKSKVPLKHFIVLLFLFFILLSVIQTRNVLFAVIFSLFFVNLFILKKYYSFVVIGIISIFGGSVLAFFQPELFLKYVELYGSVFSSESTVDSVRFHTIMTVLTNLYHDYFTPQGSLSLLWGGGFTRYYGNHFFLADVGLVGLFFRYGIFSFIIIGLLIYILVKSYKLIPAESTLVRYVFVSWLAYFIITLPLSTPLEYRGYILGLIIALAVGAKFDHFKKVIDDI